MRTFQPTPHVIKCDVFYGSHPVAGIWPAVGKNFRRSIRGSDRLVDGGISAYVNQLLPAYRPLIAESVATEYAHPF